MNATRRAIAFFSPNVSDKYRWAQSAVYRASAGHSQVIMNEIMAHISEWLSRAFVLDCIVTIDVLVARNHHGHGR